MQFGISLLNGYLAIYGVYIIAIIFIIFALMLVWIMHLQKRINRLFTGRETTSLEDTIVSSVKDIAYLKKFEQECVTYFNTVEHRLNRSIQAIETERFNPFKGEGVGGSQSFATVLISEKGDGVVISSLYSRDRISIFSKPIAKFKSAFDLTDEENNVLKKASTQLKK